MPELQLEVATPERMLVQEEVAEVQIPTVNGFIGILPGHPFRSRSRRKPEAAPASDSSCS